MGLKNLKALHKVLGLETLEDRSVPAIVALGGSMQITDTSSSPNYTILPNELNTTRVPENDNIVATYNATYNFTDDELALVRNGSFTTVQKLWWLEYDWPDPNTEVKKATAAVTFTSDGQNVVFAPPNFNSTNGANTGGLEGARAEYFTELFVPGIFNANIQSGFLYLSNGALSGGNPQGARTGTTNIGYSSLLKSAEPTLAMAGMNGYKILTWNSTDGHDISVTAGNTSGFNLYATSSSTLDDSAGRESLEFESGTSFSLAYSNGDTDTGLWSGSAVSWAIREPSSGTYYHLTGFSVTDIPTSLIGINDGETAQVLDQTYGPGDQAVWLTFQTETDTISFLVVPSESLDNTDPTALTDTANSFQGVPVLIDVMSNDSDSDGHSLALNSFTQGANGTVTRNDNGTPLDLTDDTLTYTPDTFFVGTDSFTYQIDDGHNGTASATVVVTIFPPNRRALNDDYNNENNSPLSLAPDYDNYDWLSTKTNRGTSLHNDANPIDITMLGIDIS